MTKREIRQMKKAVLALAAVLALVLTASALGDDFSQGKGAKAAPHWKVLSLGSGHRTQKPAQVFADGIGFAFGTTPDPRLFLTDYTGSGLLGDLTGKTLTATFTITGTATAFTAGARPAGERLRRHARIGAPLLRAQIQRPNHELRRGDNGGRPRRRTS